MKRTAKKFRADRAIRLSIGALALMLGIALTSCSEEARLKKRLEKEGFDVSTTGLFRYIQDNDLETMSILLSHGIKPNFGDDNTTGLEFALDRGLTDMAALLLENGADPEYETFAGKAMITAISMEYFDIVKLLLEKGYNVNSLDKFGDAPLHGAVIKLDKKIIRLLLEWGADPNIRDANKGWTPLILLADRSGPYRTLEIQVANILLEYGADLSLTIEEGRYAGNSALSMAEMQTYEDMAQFLERCRDSIYNTTRLDVYMRDYDVAGARKLIAAGVQPSGSMIETAVWRARRAGRMQILSLLNEPPTRAVLIDTFVDRAWENKETDIKTMAAAGVDINAKNSEGLTALMKALLGTSRSAVWVLLEAGADVNVRDSQGRTALMWASMYPDDFIASRYSSAKSSDAESVLEAGAEVNVRDNKGWTALMYAIVNENRGIIRLLLGAGADVTAKGTKDGQTALKLAESKGGFYGVVDSLKKAGAPSRIAARATFRHNIEVSCFLALLDVTSYLTGWVLCLGVPVNPLSLFFTP